MKKLKEMREQLKQLAEAEAMKLWRIARRAQKHGCSAELVQKIREEANWLHTTGQAYPDRLLEWEFEYKFKFAFKM